MLRNRILPLFATTALVAVAGTASAQLLSGTSTTAVLMTSNTVNITPTFLTGANWNISGGPAIEISGTGAAIISLQTGATVSGTSNNGAIMMRPNNAITAVTVNNSGTIVNLTTNGAAISTTLGTGQPVTVNNVGTISGSINTGNGIDTINNQGGTINGALLLDAGNNIVTVNGGAVNGAVTTLGGDDNLTVSGNGVLTGAVDLGDGANLATVTGGTSRVVGAFVTGGGADILNLVSGGYVSGTINLGSGSNILNISGTTAYTTRGNITNASAVNISNTTVTINHTLGSTTSLSGNAASKVIFNQNATLSGAVTSSGTIQVGAGAILAADTMNINGGLLTVDVASSTSAGRLNLAGGATTAPNTRLFINMLNLANTTVASGTVVTAIQGNAASSATLVNAAKEGVFTFRAVSSGNNVSVTIGRVSASTVVEGDANKSLANAFESLTPGQVTGTLSVIQGQINTARSASAVNDVLDSLNPSLSGMGAASVAVTNATGAQLSNRMASLRQGIATGSANPSGNVWIEGFGTSNEQDDKKGNRGYESTGAGVTLGADTTALMPGTTVGAAFSYGSTNVESNSTNRAETDIESYIITGYGSRELNDGVFVNGQLGVGMNGYEMERVIPGVGTAKASPDGLQVTAKAEVGRDIAMNGWKLTPIAGAQYTHLKVDSYTETGVGNAGLTVKPGNMDALDVSLGGRVAYDLDVAGGTLTPSVRAALSNRIGDTSMDSSNRFLGGGSTFSTAGLEADRTTLNVGTGLMFGATGGTEFSADYDATLRDSLTGHAFKLKARMPF